MFSVRSDGVSFALRPVVQDETISQTELGAAFTFQGRLNDGDSLANGEYDFQFKLYDSLSGGNQIGVTLDHEDVVLISGLFTVQLDFGDGAFNGNMRYLEIGVRSGSSAGNYTTLTPRQILTAAPYAQYAVNAGVATDFSGSLTGDVVGNQSSTL